MRKRLRIRKIVDEYQIKLTEDEPLYMCATAFEEYFDLSAEPEEAPLTLVVSDRKPRGSQDNIFNVVRPYKGDHSVWCFGPGEEQDSGGPSPWDCEFDTWLNESFPGIHSVYAWVE